MYYKTVHYPSSNNYDDDEYWIVFHRRWWTPFIWRRTGKNKFYEETHARQFILKMAKRTVIYKDPVNLILDEDLGA